MARLVLLDGDQAVPFALPAGAAVLGRHPDCDVQLQSHVVSRRHARLVRDGKRYLLEDLESGNGTFLNGKRIQAPSPLGHGDEIKLGPVAIRFEDPPAEKSAAAATVAGVDLSSEAGDENPAILDTMQHGSGFGQLEVRPEAKLKGVLEIARSLAGTVELQLLLPKVLETLFQIFPQADRGSILLKDPETGRMFPAAQRHRRDGGNAAVKLSRTILDRVLDEKTGILSADAASDRRFQRSESISALTIRSMLCVPLLSLEEEPLGVISLDTQKSWNRFTKDDLDLLMAIAGQTALSYESMRFLVSHMEKRKQDEEMQIARNVQQALLPEKLPEIGGWSFYASYDSAQAVGGDYYDVMRLGGERICLSFGDVAGKGVPAALLMSRLSSCVRSVLNYEHDVGAAVTAINRFMGESTVEGRFVTYILIVIDLQTGAMSLVNAGHMSPLIRRADGGVEEFGEETIGVPLGVVEDYPYEVADRALAPGETVVIVTDGVDEAMDPAGELYTKARVMEFVRDGPGHPAALGEALLTDVRRHAAGRSQNDDITIMAFGRTDGAGG